MLSQVTHHSAIFPLSMRKIAPKSNCALRPEGGNGPIGPCCVPFIGNPGGDVIALGDQKLDGLHGVGENRGILGEKLLDLIEAASLDRWRRVAVADNIRRHEIVEGLGPTGVPCVEELPDNCFVLLGGHGEASLRLLCAVGIQTATTRRRVGKTTGFTCVRPALPTLG